MRWLLLKDLQILRRSPLLVALLVLYPIVVAVLIGVALSRGPEKPAVAVVNQIPQDKEKVSIGGNEVDVNKYSDELTESIDPIPVKTPAEARKKVEDGEALAAIIIPPDFLEKLTSEGTQAQVEVIYNNEDPVKAEYVQSTITSKLAEANAALSREFSEIALGYLDLILKGGEFELFGNEVKILGLMRSERLLRGVAATLPEGSARQKALLEVAQFAQLAISNLDISDDVLKQVVQPITAKQTTLDGPTTPLDSFAVAVAATISLMFVTVLLAAGMLALEREENAFGRLVRGLVTKTALIAEKLVLAAGCALVVTIIMLAGIAAFVGLDWGRFPLWLAALAAGGQAFGALGVALGALAREVRAASLLALLLSLPLAFLALVPSGAVSSGLYTVIEIVSAIFPFKPAMDALNAALNDTGDSIWIPILHLLGLMVGFGAIGRVALRRFA
jgi:ABC-type multidrug transport system permease subunit